MKITSTKKTIKSNGNISTTSFADEVIFTKNEAAELLKDMFNASYDLLEERILTTKDKSRRLKLNKALNKIGVLKECKIIIK